MRRVAVYYCALGVVVLALDLAGGRSPFGWEPPPLWHGLVMGPLLAVGLAWSIVVAVGKPRGLWRAARAALLLVGFAAGTAVSGVMAYLHLARM